MIQRIQTIWFLLAIVVMGLTFMFALYQSPNVMVSPSLYVGENFLGILFTGISMLLSCYTLILYKKRKKQITFTWLSIIATLSTFAYLFVVCEQYLETEKIVGGNYWLGLFTPLLSVVFLFLGLLGIRKDEKLIKSLDRLR